MKSKYKPYSSYRDSGVEWLGKIPMQWEINKIGYAFHAKKGVHAALYTKEYCGTIEGEYPVYSGQTENNGILSKIHTFEFDAGEEGYLFSTTVGAKAMSLSHLRGKFSLSQNCMVIIPMNKDIVTRFQYYHLQPKFLYERGLIPEHMQASFRMEDLYSYKFALPPLQEQQAIANYLDSATAKIDILIEKQTKLIALLKEKRQAVISTAVTRGLDNTVAMKDSGVEWLGEIPEHWVLPKISYVGSVTNGSTPDKSNKEYWTNGTIPWLASGCLNIDKVIEPTGLISNNAYESCSVEIIPLGSLLVGMVGQGKTRGTSALLGIDACINQNLAAVIPTDKILVKFLHFLFQAMYKSLREAGRGSNQAALNCDIIKSIRIPFPAIHEQEEITKYIDNKTTKIDTLISKATKAIELLKEKRTALISSAVTGKIDVREIA